MKKQFEEKKSISQEEVFKFKEWYIPSKSENTLMNRILFEIENSLKEKGIIGKVKWCSPLLAKSTIPFNMESKAECICSLPFSMIVRIESVDSKNETVTFSFCPTKKQKKKETKILDCQPIIHGYINHEERLAVYCVEKVKKNNQLDIEKNNNVEEKKKNYNNFNRD